MDRNTAHSIGKAVRRFAVAAAMIWASFGPAHAQASDIWLSCKAADKPEAKPASTLLVREGTLFLWDQDTASLEDRCVQTHPDEKRWCSVTDEAFVWNYKELYAPHERVTVGSLSINRLDGRMWRSTHTTVQDRVVTDERVVVAVCEPTQDPRPKKKF